MRIQLGILAVCLVCLTGPCRLQAQQVNVNLDYNPQKSTDNLIPFGATHKSPDVRDDRTVTFRLMAPAAREVLLSGVAVLTALGAGNKAVPSSLLSLSFKGQSIWINS